MMLFTTISFSLIALMTYKIADTAKKESEAKLKRKPIRVRTEERQQPPRQ